ncbi:MAG: ABC transporter permease [Microbacteriaceae bacterium]
MSSSHKGQAKKGTAKAKPDANLAPQPDLPMAAEPTIEPSRWRVALDDIVRGSALRTFLAIIAAFAVGAVLIVITNEDFLRAAGYIFSRPTDAFSAAGEAIANGYGALFKGSVLNLDGKDFVAVVRPFTETLRFAGPLIMAGLGIALSFRVGLFNIGGQGQLLFGAGFAGWASFQVSLPFPLHLLFAMVIGVLAAAAFGSIVGLLKAKTGANEVIVTIMLNYIAFNLLTYVMRTPILQDPTAGGTPKTLPPDASAQLPPLFGDSFALHWGFPLAIGATVLFWWLMERSTIGYRFRAVGLNSNAARTAGINVDRMYIVAMAFSAAFVGLAGVNQALGRTAGFTPSIDSGIGFDAITVALLGGSNALGVFLAGILFGAMKAGGPAMQVADVAPELLLVVQGLIVLFIAAPPLVRAMFRLPAPRTKVPAAPAAKVTAEKTVKK